MMLLRYLLAAALIFAPLSNTNAGWFPLVQGAVCGGFTPLSLGSNLIAWYKADVGALNGGTGVQATNGQSVDTWQDQSGHGYNATPHGFNSPVMNTTAVNSKEGVVWSASNVNALLTDPIASGGSVVWGTGTTYSVYILGSGTANGAGSGFSYTVTGGPSVDPNGGELLAQSGNTFGFVHASNQQYPGSFTLNTVTRFGAIGDGTNFTPYVNNVAGTTSALSFTFGSPGAIWLGMQSGWDGPTREIIFVNKALNSAEQSNMDCYLTNRQ